MKKVAGLALSVLMGLSIPVMADTYKIDTSHSAVQFSVKHMVLSNTRGAFGSYNGDIQWDKDPAKSSISGTIKVDSIDTRDTKRDEHLRGADFFDAAKYPEIKFVSKSIKKKKNEYVVVGDLTMKGVTKSVTIPLEVNGPIKDPWGNQRLSFSGQFKLNRQEYGVSWSKSLDNGGLVVGDDVVVDLEIEAVKAN